MNWKLLILGIFIMAITIASALAVTNDASAYYSFDDEGNYTAEIYGTTGTTGILKAAMNFNGAGNYEKIVLPTTSHSNNFTLNMWIKSSAWGSQNNYLYSTHSEISSLAIDMDTGSNILRFYNGSNWNQLNGDTFTSNTWEMFTMTYNSTTVKVYKNGVNYQNVTTTIGIASGTNCFLGGRYDSPSAFGWDGDIDDFVIYNTPLNQANINSLYSSGVGAKANTVATSNIVFYNDMDSLNDSSSNENYVTGENGVTLTTTTNGKLNQAIYFDGTNDYITNNLVKTWNSYTISGWINKSAGLTNDDTIIGSKENNDNKLLIRLRSGDFLECVEDRNGTEVNVRVYDGSFLNGWNHIACVGNQSNNLKIYVNGIEKNSSSIAGDGIVLPTAGLWIGALNNAGTPQDYYEGETDEIAIYERALNLAEVQALYNSGTGYNPYATPVIPPIDYFTITVTDEWSGADVNNITVQIGTIGNCYQETANISTTCGGLNTGTYTYENDGYNGNIYINYTKPAGATSAISYFKSFTTNGNYSIPESCFNNNDILQIKMTSVNAGVTGVNSLSCYNGSWNSLYNSGAGSLCGGSFNGGFKNLAIDGNFNTYEQSWAGSLGRHCDVGLDYTAIYEEGIYWYINKTYTNSTGNVITTNIDSSLNYVEDVEISGTNYFSRTYTDYNISADLAAELHQSEVNFQPYQLITNTTISGSNCTINTTTKLCSAEWNLTAGDYDVIVSNVAYYNLTEEVTITTLQSSTINIYELYSSILNITLVNSGNGSSINNFTGYVYNTVNDWNDSFITTNGTAQVNLLDNLTYTVHINGLTNVSNTVEDTILVNGTSDSIELSTYTWNSILINYKDVETLATINNVTLEIISTPYANNYSTTTGSMYLTLLTPTTYTLRYASEGYNNGFYEFTVDDDSGENITLYMMSNSTSDEITVLVYDQSANKVEGATIKALRYDITSNSYLIQSIKTTNSEGEVVMQLQKNTEFYKFIAEYAGETRTTTIPSYITSDQVVIQISLADKLFEEIFEELGIESNLQFEESNDRFKWTYNVPSNILTGEVCLYTYSTSMNNDPVLLNNTCSSSAAGIIYLNIYSPVNGTTYIAKAYYDDTFLQQESYTYGNDLDLGQIGLFIQLLLTIAFISITLWNPALIPIGVSGSLMIGRIVHLTQFGWAPLWVLMVVSIVISYMINRGRT